MTSSSQYTYWQEQTDRRSPTHPAVKEFVTPKLEFIFDTVELRDSSTVLDVGCGNGYFTHYLQAVHRTVGLDYSRNMLTLNPVERLVQGSALSLPFGDDRFELVFCSNLLHHVDQPATAVREMKRVSDEYVVFSEPNRANPLMFGFSLLIPEERKGLRFSQTYLRTLAEACDLTVLDSRSMGSVVPNKTPESLLPLFKLFDGSGKLMFYNCLVART